jgi:hypothetical protein
MDRCTSVRGDVLALTLHDGSSSPIGRKHMTLAKLGLVLVMALSGCVLDTTGGGGDDGSGPPDPDPEPTYHNHVYLECNGDVLVDQTFTSRDACVDFADGHTFWCGPIKLPVSC